MSTLLEQKCPCCGGAVEFNVGAQRLKCPYCDAEFDIPAMQQAEEFAANTVEQINWNSQGSQWGAGETDGNISVTNGTASASKAVAGTTVTLTADAAPAGKVFDKWVVTGATVADTSSATTTFAMPKNDVTVEATYKDKTYNVAVTNGTASASKAVAGATVTLTADAAPAGKVFDKWVITGATVADTSKATTTFTMPENDVTAQATYKNVVYKVTVTNGKASASTAVMGDSVTLTANQIDGKVFSHWEVSGATASDKNAKETTVTVGASDVTAEAIYEDCPCKCHKGGIAGFFYKIVLFFQKLFGNNKICEFCGAKH